MGIEDQSEDPQWRSKTEPDLIQNYDKVYLNIMHIKNIVPISNKEQRTHRKLDLIQNVVTQNKFCHNSNRLNIGSSLTQVPDY